jgi:hypothetical protein
LIYRRAYIQKSRFSAGEFQDGESHSLRQQKEKPHGC